MGGSTNMHVSRRQARTLLAAARFTGAMVEALETRDVDHDLPTPADLHTVEMMLTSALVRIRDLEERRA